MRNVLLSGTILALLSSGAFAADMYAAPEAAPGWSGVYLGGTGGWVMGDKIDLSAYGESLTHDIDGFVAGGFIGYNYQAAPVLIIGGELTGLGSWVDGNKDIYGINTETHLDAIALAELRAGLTFDRALLFVSGGYAGAQLNGQASYEGNTLFDESDWVNGWTIGGGIDFKVTDNVFVGVKYNHIELSDGKLVGDFGHQNEGGGNDITVKADAAVDQILGRVGFAF
jgi:outer membrane immunogenic protein